MTFTEAENVISRGVDRLLAGAALRAFGEMANSSTTISRLSVPENWPEGGEIRFTRDADGKRVCIGMRGLKVYGHAK